MDTIKPFIDLGWHTVPLSGKLERLDDGAKTTPQFEKAWKSKYTNEMNTKAARIGGVLTGKVSNILAIDGDNQDTYELFRHLNPDYQFEFISQGKPSGGGTIVYELPADFDIPSFSLQDDIIKLDFFADEGFVYLPTEKNTTKKPWNGTIPTLAKPPPSVIMQLRLLYRQYALAKGHKIASRGQADNSPSHRFNLAPQVAQFTASGKFLPSLFRILTPKDFRDTPQYLRDGFLHPKDVPAGRGSEYLSQVSAILGADSSVSGDLYQSAILLINELWAVPMPSKRLHDTIITPMVSGNASINGKPIWRHDPNWDLTTQLYTSKRGDLMEAFYDDRKQQVFLVNHSEGSLTSFDMSSNFYSHFQLALQRPPKRPDLIASMQAIPTVTNPALPFGFIDETDHTKMFNLFRSTPLLDIIADPAPYAPKYRKPHTIIRFFETLVPDVEMRVFLLRFLLTKFKTFGYSPVVLFFIGASGTGKDTFVSLVGKIIGEVYVAKPSAKEFLEHYNGWILDKYFVQLDEFGDQLSSYREKQEALGKLKTYTGRPTLQVRQMRTDAYTVDHSITFISTSNRHPLVLDHDDRRMAIFETPNPLVSEDWVQQAGGISEVLESMDRELPDFAYYLATEIKPLTMDEYHKPPDSSRKKLLIASTLPPSNRIAYLVQNGMAEDFIDLVEEYCGDFGEFDTHYFQTGRIYWTDLLYLFSHMTEDRGTDKALTVAFKNLGVAKIPTTKGGAKSYYCEFRELANHKY